MDEEKLIPRILDGDEAAFNELYTAYSLKAYRTALLITGNVQTAEDTVQETFVTCCRSLNKLKSYKAFPSYFYRVLTRTAWRLSSADRRTDQLDENSLASAAADMPKDYSELYEAIAALDTKLRTTVILFYFNDLPVRDIARITGVLEGTVKSRLHYARRKLSKILEKEDYYG